MGCCVPPNERLLKYFREQPCEFCGAPPPSQPHHIYCRGLGGGSRLDKALNLLSVCRECHMKIHCGVICRGECWNKAAQREGLGAGCLAEEAVWRLLQPKR